jgi:outer membrane protein TolC
MPHNLSALRHCWPILSCLLVAVGCQHIPRAETIMPPRRLRETVIEQPACPADVADAVKDGKPIPICLDTVLRLAQDKNGQVRLARMRLADAETDQEWANKRWLPDLSVGIGAYHHDGGIQDFQGNLVRSDYNSALAGLEVTGKYDPKELLFRRVEAERRVWTQKGDLSKLTSENLLDASTTYIDLLSARTGVVVSQETEVHLKGLLEQAKALAKIDPGTSVEVSRIETELMAQSVLSVKLREASKGSAAKLAYLLGLDPCCEFVVADKKLVPISLVDVAQPTQVLVEHALTRGPGVRELEGLLHTVEAARSTNDGWSHWMPSIEVNMVEGGFGASPAGQDFAWANRFDFGVHMKWNLSEFVYAKQRRHQADANIEQVHLSYQDLRSKLTLGVQEARDAIHSGREQVQLAEKHITYAEESYKLSSTRLKENIKGRSTSEVLLALRALGGARLEYLQAVRDLDKANLRLFILVGALEAECEK